MLYESKATALLSLEQVKRLLEIECFEELSEEEMDAIGASVGDVILVASTRFEDGLAIDLYLMSGSSNYWLEWLAYEGHCRPLNQWGMFEPEFELDLNHAFEINSNEYRIEIEPYNKGE